VSYLISLSLNGSSFGLFLLGRLGVRFEEADAVEELGGGEEREGFLLKHIF
jgi:hypothetical protein